MKKKKYNNNKVNKSKIFTQPINTGNILENKFIICIIIINIKIVLEYHILISILLLVFVWLFNIDIIIYIYNNHKLFLIFIFFIERIVGVVAIFYKKNNIFII